MMTPTTSPSPSATNENQRVRTVETSPSATLNDHVGICVMDDDHGDGDEVGCWLTYALRRFFKSPIAIGLCASILILVTGTVLWVVTAQNQQEDYESKRLSPLETREYWMRMRQQMIPAGVLLIPDSPEYKALQFMAVEDPLRPIENEERIQQRFALLTLYYEWSGNHWDLVSKDGWPKGYSLYSSYGAATPPMPNNAGGSMQTNKLNVSTSRFDSFPDHECDWFGIQCNKDRAVVALELDGEESNVDLTGTISTQIGLLPELQTLSLRSFPSLMGSLPSEIQNLEALSSLSIAHTSLTSVDFDVMAAVSDLRVLHLNNNMLDGTVSTFLTQLSNLQVLDLGGNEQLKGELLNRITEWPQIHTINFAATKISGALPQNIGRLSLLHTLKLHFSSYSGSIPTSIGNCSELFEFSMYASNMGDGLTGTIPTQVGQLKALNSLSFAFNDYLNTTLPTQLGHLTNLRLLEFNDAQQIHGPLPTELGKLTKLEYFMGLNTAITGNVPEEFENLSSLKIMNFVGTSLTGTVPEGICDITSLLELEFSCRQSQVDLIEPCACCQCYSV